MPIVLLISNFSWFSVEALTRLGVPPGTLTINDGIGVLDEPPTLPSGHLERERQRTRQPALVGLKALDDTTGGVQDTRQDVGERRVFKAERHRRNVKVYMQPVSPQLHAACLLPHEASARAPPPMT